jgi:hypothetical protein
MATIDLSTGKADITFTEDSYTPITFTFTGQDFTGYTLPQLLWSLDKGATPANSIAGAFNAEDIDFIVDATVWTAIGDAKKGTYQVEYLDPSGNRVIRVSGGLTFEQSLST